MATAAALAPALAPWLAAQQNNLLRFCERALGGWNCAHHVARRADICADLRLL